MSELKHSPLPWKACWYDWAEKNYIDIKVEGDHSQPGIATLSGSYLNSREVEANSLFIVEACNAHYDLTAQLAAKDAVISKLREGLEITKDTSDGYHTFGELYDYRRVYNALLFNEWAKLGLYDIHKSWRHSDGEHCFGGGWFIVVAQLPTGQISNHYKKEHWDEFCIPERELPVTYDGHTPGVALDRARALLAETEVGRDTAHVVKQEVKE